MARIELTGLNKDFAGRQVLSDINLSIAEGEFLALVGPSGCGKSTLLRVIAGLEPISSGSVAFDGEPVDTLPPQARNIAMVFQSYALYPHMKVRDNLAFGLKQHGLPRSERDRRIAVAAQALELEPLLDRYPRALSGGQRQRVALGRAMVREPRAFLLDEPLSNLDAQLRVSTRLEIRTLQKRLGMTMIYTTHDQVEAITLADRIAVMSAGRIVQVATPLDLYDFPANRFVAGFIGSPAMNFIPGTRRADAIHTAGGAVIGLPEGDVDGPDDIVVGLRPEHLTLDIDSVPAAHRLDATVRHVENLGSEAEIYVEAGGTRLCLRHFGRRLPDIGTQVRIGFDPARLHLFDARSNERIGPRHDTRVNAS
ncbi:ABC transporter ATP-binding protein [Bradyrhizobium sp. BTAi1]|uniref:ABC transporter ATP-binding protein n=2 Tax=unclassified Bradyrhizobium TaxID=2631580 RepID=UPI00005E1406|nr:ABC transporter ATP-binding protein [Bradyrhizobium sp. BTAi1]ABQ34699.1 carbohydrate ABC transporter ATP-binding protein, CUT1 family [Bradyrhizobium sp. BTAi1]